MTMNHTIRLDYIVLRCADLARSRRFYEALDLHFEEQKHGRGPTHLATTLGSVVLELYPLTSKSTAGLRFGIRVRVLLSCSKRSRARTSPPSFDSATRHLKPLCYATLMAMSLSSRRSREARPTPGRVSRSTCGPPHAGVHLRAPIAWIPAGRDQPAQLRTR
jgi:hypothetical protein